MLLLISVADQVWFSVLASIIIFWSCLCPCMFLSLSLTATSPLEVLVIKNTFSQKWYWIPVHKVWQVSMSSVTSSAPARHSTDFIIGLEIDGGPGLCSPHSFSQRDTQPIIDCSSFVCVLSLIASTWVLTFWRPCWLSATPCLAFRAVPICALPRRDTSRATL